MPKVERLNYCSKAIPALDALTPVYQQQGMPKSALANYAVARLLERSVKFLMPPGGELFESKGYRETELALMAPPYSITVAEAHFPYQKPDHEDRPNEVPVHHRIVLCLDMREAQTMAASMMNMVFDESFLVFAIFFYMGKWIVYPIAIEIPVSPEPVYVDPNQYAADYGISDADLRSLDMHWTKTGLSFRQIPHTLGEAGESEFQNESNKAAYLRILRDLSTEVRLIIQLMTVLNCENVQTSTVEIPEALQKKREKKGKHPLYEYKVLELGQERTSTSHGSAIGDRFSPRFHLRRGHIRRLPSGKVTWVRAHTVGNKELGVVDKDYAVSNDPE